MEKTTKTVKVINPYRMFTGSFVPNWLLCRKELNPGDKVCYARLAQFAGKDGECFPEIPTLAEELGVSPRQVDRYLAVLMDIALEYLKHTPYGILVCVENEVQHEGELLGVYHNIKVVKSGKCLHNGKVSENIVKQTIRRICSENYNLRSKKNGKNNEDGKGN